MTLSATVTPPRPPPVTGIGTWSCAGAASGSSASSVTTEPKRRRVAWASSVRPSISRNLADSGMKPPSRIRINPVGRFRNHMIRQPKIGCSTDDRPLASR